MRGRRPKPVEQRALEGNPGKRPVPARVAIGGDPPEAIEEPPRHLDGDAQFWWREAVPVLRRVGIVDVVDRPSLEMCACAYSRFRSANRLLRKQGIYVRDAKTGEIREHPALRTEREAMVAYQRIAEQYGLTPVARTRLGLAELQRLSLAQELDQSLGEVVLEQVE